MQDLLFELPYSWGLDVVVSQALMLLRRVLLLGPAVSIAVAAPSAFPATGNGLWYTDVGGFWTRWWLPVGNGYLAAMTPGGTYQEITQLNIESLWSGGPFQDPTYNGGNPLPNQTTQMADAMQAYRAAIFASPTGDIDNIETLATDAGDYGSYVGAGFFISNLNTTGPVTNYARWLDLDQGIARASWTQDGSDFTRETFCSHPTQACTQHVSSASGSIPSSSFVFSSDLEVSLPTPNVTCLNSDTLMVRGLAGEPGMLYELLFHVRSTGGTVSCSQFEDSEGANATVSVTGHNNITETWVSWVGSTEFDLDAGDAAHNFTFRGADPHAALLDLITAPAVATASYSAIRSQHFADFDTTFNTFQLDLGQTAQLSTPTNELITSYEYNTGNPYLEWVMFNFGRYLLGSSARGTLPANLQGKWAGNVSNPWSADYHSNINIQMNYWSAEMSNLDVTESLFTYFEKNWAPRGAYTAQVLYNISRGWVTHDEMNIFGHTGMKAGGNTAQWADYPESAVWMMIHVWDHFDYTNDITWWKSQGWPLVKGVASFHLDKLIPDESFKDGTLVTAPCNSPEQVPITFGCAHAQQVIWQLFNAVEKGYAASGDTDTALLEEVRAKKAAMDKGLRIGWWGQLQEWKWDQDMQNDTHRHLSHLIGLYPGYAIANFNPDTQGTLLVNGTNTTYTKPQIIDAATTSLIHRGNGTGPDADAGWEKMWRAAAWAQLGNASEFYFEFTYAIYENFGENLFSLYDPFDAFPIFQIDANLGLPGALLNSLIQAPDTETYSTTLTVKLLPALPSAWNTGSIKNARVRGGMTLSFAWKDGTPTNASIQVDSSVVSRPVEVVFGGKVVDSFTTSRGMKRTITKF
ncbi:Glycoside hydrolase family 95 protein [Mycena chlorophos]|uniref:Glycoside hydrolase family 95 protein n=1 Tax=Mycena chlorophos TaxID=658473 RepID=A0A8H6TAK0_MYCCL|nr:Glycoside hydrolase family 95 protein [Mycena chlorophos]